MRVDPREYYRGERSAEVAVFLEHRWAAAARGDLWLRWVDGDRPLVVRGPGDVEGLAAQGWRSFYGTIELFSRLEDRSDVEEDYPRRVVAATSFIDVDIVDESLVREAWIYAVEAGRVLAEALCRLGVCRSVYLLWSGAGLHVRVHEDALRGGHGLDPVEAAYLAAEAAIREARGDLEAIVSRSGGAVKVENVVARKRLFTAPLSLHRRLDYAAVAFRPDAAGSFTLSWAEPGTLVHDPEAWRSAVPGETARMLREALEKLGRAPERSVVARPAARLPGGRVKRTSASPREPGRFPVMALLQAARYYLLTGDLEKAKSFGLNRAIFYAWAKYYGPARSAAARIGGPAARYSSRRAGRVELRRVEGVEERVPVSESGWFAMGGVEQRPEDFDRHVARRFEDAGIPFEEAWRAALEYVSRFPRSVLRDPQLFYKRVYEPVRDAFVEKVLGRERGARAREPWQASEPRGRGDQGRKREPGPEPRRRSLLDWIEDREGG